MTLPFSKTYKKIQSKLRIKRIRKRVIRFSLLGVNLLALTIILVVVFYPSSKGSTITNDTAAPANADSTVTNPLDRVSSVDIALTVARMSSLPETTAITNQAQSESANVTIAPTTDNVITKPQVVATALKSKADIKNYTTVAGDTVSSVANKFGVTSDSIRWSNGISGEALTPGKKLVIPPVNGVVYVVRSGDSIDSIVQKFGANRESLVAFNDLDFGGLVVGSQIVVPNGFVRGLSTATQIRSASFPWGSSPIYGYNGYDYGYCTWYVANRLPVPSNWGNANTWDNLAPMSGWSVSTAPKAGAVAQSNRGYFGHVAVVEAVSPDGTMIKYSDMNGLAGFGRVGYSDWVPASKFNNYIYR